MREPISEPRICARAGFLALWLVFLAVAGQGVATGSPPPVSVGREVVADSGGDSPNRASRYRSELERIWLTPGSGFADRGKKIRRRALALGVGSLDSPARALISAADDGHSLARRGLAVKLAPDLPLAHAAMGAAYWGEGEYADAIAEYAESILSIPRHLEASVWLVGSLLMILAGALICGSLAFIFAAGLSALGRGAHDGGDLVSRRMPSFARAALICSLLGIPLLLGEGLLGMALVLLALGVIYGGRLDRAVLACACLALLLGLYPFLQASGKLLSALNADPLASASLALIRGSETPQQLALLLESEPGEDPLVDRTLAVYARRLAASQEASERFRRIVEADPGDAFSLTILGNIAFEAGQTREAIAYYEEGRRGRGGSAELMFDLSQAYAKIFQMEDGEFALARAQEIDGSAVAEFLALDDSNFVADPPFSIAPIRKRMIAAASGRPMVEAAAEVVGPGWLGEAPSHAAGGLALAFLAGLLVQGRFGHASKCLRCGRRICARCDGEIDAEDLCDACHHLFREPGETDPRLRKTRIEVLLARDDRLGKLGVMASILIPGFAGFRARRPDLAYTSLLLFVAAFLFIIWRDGVVPDPVAVGAGGIFALGFAAFLLSIVYLGVLFTSLISWRHR